MENVGGEAIGLVQADLALHEGVVVGVAHSADRRGDPFEGEVLGEGQARVPRAGVAVRDQLLGYMELDRRGAELLFQVLTEREEKNAIAIATNQSFSGWTDTFTDPRLCAPSSTDSPTTAPSSKPALPG